MHWLLMIGGMIVVVVYNSKRRDDARLALARTVYGEARGEGVPGMEAVANVVMNRAGVGGWWGDTVLSVVMKPYQFSVWNPGDPNRALILGKFPFQGDELFNTAWQIAGDAIAFDLPDRTGGATHYHTTAVKPDWASGQVPVAQIGRHVFYEGIA